MGQQDEKKPANPVYARELLHFCSTCIHPLNVYTGDAYELHIGEKHKSFAYLIVGEVNLILIEEKRYIYRGDGSETSAHF